MSQKLRMNLDVVKLVHKRLSPDVGQYQNKTTKRHLFSKIHTEDMTVWVIIVRHCFKIISNKVKSSAWDKRKCVMRSLRNYPS